MQMLLKNLDEVVKWKSETPLLAYLRQIKGH